MRVFSRTRNLYELEQCSILYEKLLSHVIEMLRRYWLEVPFIFFTIFRSWLLLVVSYFFRLFGNFVDYRLLSGKK